MPGGKPKAVPIPVTPVVVCVIVVIAEFTQTIGELEAGETVFSGFTVIVPVAFTVLHPPVNGIVYANNPEAVGIPLIIIVLANQVAVIPGGKFVAIPIPEAPVVVCVIVVSVLLIQIEGEVEVGITVLFGVTVMVPVALNVPQPPVNGMV